MSQSPVALAPVLGLEKARYDHIPFIYTESELWGVWCLRAQDERPRLTALWKTQARAQQYLTFVLQSTWKCPRCGWSLGEHRPLQAETFGEHQALDTQASAGADEPAPKGQRRAARNA
jgi:hypothetical protein